MLQTVTFNTKSGPKTAYRVQFTLNGKRHYRQFKTQRAARRFAENLGSYRAAEARRSRLEGATRLHAFCDRWLTDCEKGRDGRAPLERGTIEAYRANLDLHIKPLIEDQPIRQVTPADIREFRDALLARMSRSHAKKVLSQLGAILRYAVDLEELSGSPAAGISITVPARSTRRVAIHTKAQMRTILAMADRMAEGEEKGARTAVWRRYRAMLGVLVYGGLRISEVCGLPRGAVDAIGLTIEVSQRLDKFGNLGPPKSARGHRAVDLPEVAIVRLVEHAKTHRHQLMFATTNGQPMSVRNFTARCWTRIQELAGVPYRNLHSARHFFASRQIEAGANVKELSLMMGHADEAFTLRVYGHLFHDADTRKRRKARAEALVL